MKVHAPSYQMYPNDFESDPIYASLDLEYQAIVHRLWNLAWNQEEQGYLEFNIKTISRRFHITPKRFKRIWLKVAGMFMVCQKYGENSFKILENFEKNSRNFLESVPANTFIFSEKQIAIREAQTKHYLSSVLNGMKGGRPCKKLYNPQVNEQNNPRVMKPKPPSFSFNNKSDSSKAVVDDTAVKQLKVQQDCQTADNGLGVTPIQDQNGENQKTGPDLDPLKGKQISKQGTEYDWLANHMDTTYQAKHNRNLGLKFPVGESQRRIINTMLGIHDCDLLAAAWDHYLKGKWNETRNFHSVSDFYRQLNRILEIPEVRRARLKKLDLGILEKLTKPVNGRV